MQVEKKKILVLRFSAMGDVAMVASVLKEFSAQNPHVELIVVSRSAFAAFFSNIPQVKFHPIWPKDKHKGFFGLWKLFSELKVYQLDAVADLHDNIRSRVVSFFFRLVGLPIKRLDKGRAEKKALTRTENKVLIPLKLTVERYADVFRALGFENFKLSHQLERVGVWPMSQTLGQKHIGISPFAQHASKVYSLENMEKVIAMLSKAGYAISIFGGGASEKAYAEQMAAKYASVQSVIGKYSLQEELAIISKLDLMLSMDSSGMHMASLVGVPVISVWGATHPFAGFIGYGQSMEDCIQFDHPIRPNSIYGNKPCELNGKSIIDYIEPVDIVEAIKNKLLKTRH